MKRHSIQYRLNCTQPHKYNSNGVYVWFMLGWVVTIISLMGYIKYIISQ